MIFDRTNNDITKAKELRMRGIPFSDTEKEILERGTITINTLNRIEKKQSELKEILNSLGYFNASITNKSWSYTDIFNASEFQRLVDNNVVLRKAFFVFSNSPRNAVAKYQYVEINCLEKILYDLEEMAEYVINHSLECDTFYCGEV